MRVTHLWRYPVKGLLGESLAEAAFDQRGLVGDRQWAIVGRDGKLGSGKTTRRFRRMPNLFTMRASTGSDGEVVVTVNGWSGSVRDPATASRVSEVVGEQVTLEPEGAVSHHDEGAVHLVSTSSLRRVGGMDVRRLRPNVLIDVVGEERVEDSWIGGEVSLDAVRLRVTGPMPRCVMVALPQDDLPFAPHLVKRMEHRTAGCLGVVAAVERSGVVAITGFGGRTTA